MQYLDSEEATGWLRKSSFDNCFKIKIAGMCPQWSGLAPHSRKIAPTHAK